MAMRSLVLGLATTMLLLAACDEGAESDAGAEECGVLQQGESLSQGDEIQSCDGRFVFVHQGDGNVVLYQGTTPLFNTHTDGQSSSRMELRSDGNFVLTSTSGEILFSTDTEGSGLRFVMQDDGNGVIYDANDEALWATGTNIGSGEEPGGSGCSGNSDCGSCERCELSTGNCVTRLSC